MGTTIPTNTISADLMAAVNGKKAAAASADSAAGAQDRFMTLLVTQMKNQDPLNPMDNAQVTSQLAQLSTVSGIDKMNTTLESLINSVKGTQTSEATGMIGHGVFAAGSGIDLAGGKGQFGVELDSKADAVKVTIKDGSGTVVRTLDVGTADAGIKQLQWDGKTESGAAPVDGHYPFEVTATNGGEKVTATTLGYGTVSSITNGSGGVKLNVTGLGAISQSDVQQIL